MTKIIFEVHANGDKYSHLNNELHSEDGPAVEFANGYKSWYIHGKLHREDGPAIEFADSKHWFLDGKELTEELYEEMVNYKK